jgi:hypothetical protein
MKQRGFTPFIIDVYLAYAKEEHDGHGGIRYDFDHRTRKAVRKEMGRLVYKDFKHFLNGFVVECEGQIVTVGWRH